MLADKVASATLKIFRIDVIAVLIWFIAIPLFTHHHDPLTRVFWSAALLLFAFLFLKKGSPADLLQQWIDRKFFRDAYDAEVMLSQLAKTAQTISDPEALIQTVSRSLTEALHVERLTVVLRSESNGVFKPAYAIGPALAMPVRMLDHARSSAPIFQSADDGRTAGAESPELLIPLSGLLPKASYEQGSLLLCPGDLLIGYTDGISETMNPAEEEWGEEAMISAAQQASDGTAEDIVKALFEAADAFAGGASQHDDMMVLVIKLRRQFDHPGAELFIPGGAYPTAGEQRRELLEW